MVPLVLDREWLWLEQASNKATPPVLALLPSHHHLDLLPS